MQKWKGIAGNEVCVNNKLKLSVNSNKTGTIVDRKAWKGVK